jgi:signal transduction histidine kinase
LEAKSENLGSIFLANNKQEIFSSEDEALFVSIGWQVAMAVRNARLYETVQWKEKEHAEILHRVIVAQEEERKRIARELHDETSQALAALMLGLDTIGAAITHDPREAAIHQESAKAIARGLLEDIRRITTDLRPSLLDDMGLIAAVTRYGEKRLSPLGVALHLDADGLGDRRLPSDIEIALFRIIQEAITNIVRYAHASRVDVSLERQNGSVALQVSDDGQGFDPALSQAANLQDRGLGLRGMQERVSILGGEFHLRTRVGQGTTISVRVPVREERSSRV